MLPAPFEAKTSGSVKKGFAVMVGLILSCVLKWLVDGNSAVR